MLEAHGYRVLRITWWQIVDARRRTIARIRAALRDARAALSSGEPVGL